jgi:putative ABC transport system permease protein
VRFLPTKHTKHAKGMSFILKMAWRDSRASRRRLVLFSLSIVLGIAALVAIGSFNANLQVAIDGQARTLHGADLSVNSRQATPAELEAAFAALGGEQAREAAFATMIVFPTAGDRTRLVTLRALEPGFPFYGDFVTVPADAAARLAGGEAVVVLEESLLAQFGVRVGDPVRLGRATFTIAGAVRRIPGESMAVAMLSPRVIIGYDQLDETGLIGPESLVQHRRHFRWAEARDLAADVRELRGAFPEMRLGFQTVEDRKQELGRSLNNVYSYLGLVGLVALLLGGIGLASAIHVYLRQKLATVATLRCLGVSARAALAIYLAQTLGVGLVGAVVGAILGVLVQLALPGLAGGFLPVDVEFFVAWPAVGWGMGAGLVICGLFTLSSLLAVRRVPPLAAIRAVVAEESAGRDPWRGVVFGLMALGVIVLAVQQAPSWRVGLGFAGALAVSFGVLAGLARVVAWLARRLRPARAPYVWRQGVANLHRPQNRTVLLLLALGLGTFLIVTLSLTRATLVAQIEGSGGEDRPNLLFFDIQDDQVEPLETILREQGVPVRAQAPIVTMRLAAVRGRPVADILREEGNTIPGWTLRREYRSTFRENLTGPERLVAGEFVGRVDPDTAVVPISVEVELANNLQVGLGDELTWDVQGMPLVTRITSLREVEWRRLEPNFFVVFPAGVLEPAPKFHVLAARAADPAESARAQQAAVMALPNISAIDLQLVLETLDSIYGQVQLVIQFMAMFTVATGVIVLAAAVWNGRRQRIRESVLLRTLGASRRQLRGIEMVEHGILGALAALVGCALAAGASALLARHVFETSVAWPLDTFVAAVLAVSGVTLLTGWIAGRGVVDHPPLAVLRQES